MHLQPEIVNIAEKKLIGNSIQMSFSVNRTVELWRNFMPRRKEIANQVSDELISMQIYPPLFNFDPYTGFEKWACVEVTETENVPTGMKTFALIGGLYAVFLFSALQHPKNIH